MYNSVLVTKLVNSIMLDGKKGVAQKVVYGAFDLIKEKTEKEPLEVFTQAMENIMPSLEVKARRVGGGVIYNYSVLSHKETPGLGSKMDSWFVKGAKGNIIGKNPGTKGLQVSKDGGDVDAITAATISSRAFLDAVNRAARALDKDSKQK